MQRIRRAGLGVAVALALLALAELGARLFTGPVEHGGLVATAPSTEPPFLERRADGVHPVFQGRTAISPFPAEPDPRRPRVVWMGGSSLHVGAGRIRPEQEAPALLGRALPIESLNLAAPAMDSEHLLAMLPEVLVLKPALIVVYTGHNDRGNAVFYGRYGARVAWTARARGLLLGSRLYLLMERGLKGQGPQGGGATEHSRFTLGAEQAEAIRARFEQRLSELAHAVSEAGVALVLATVSSDGTRPSIEYSCPEELAAAQAGGDFEPSNCRDLAWLDAERRWRGGDLSAVAVLDGLRDDDPLGLRADSATVEAIRRVAAHSGARLADVDMAFRARGGGLEPAGWFVDPVHFSPEGHRALAALAAPLVAEALGLPDPGLEMPEPRRRR